MKALPMIFNTERVQALMDGRKVQTRRPVTFPIRYSDKVGFSFMDKLKKWWACGIGFNHSETVRNFVRSKSPWKTGDLIYVRETFYQYGRHVMPAWPEAEPEDAVFCGEKRVRFIGDELPENGRHFGESFWRKRPSIHMPRWASRTTLKVTSVRVDRVQDISLNDCIAEGFQGGHGSIPGYMYSATPKEHFSETWKQIYGDHWDNNGWCWVIDFDVVLENVDVVISEMEV